MEWWQLIDFENPDNKVRVIFEPLVCVYGPTDRTHTHHWFKNYAAKHRPSTRQTSVNHYEFQLSIVSYSLMMDHIRSETCRSDF